MNDSSSLTNLRLMLMEQVVALWRHKWLAVAAAWAVCLIGWANVAMMPRYYQSEASAFVDVNGLLTPLLKGLVVDTNALQTSEYLRQTLLSRPNLEQVATLAQLDTGMNQNQRTALINELATAVRIRSQGRNNLFTIAYTSPDPERAKNVVDAMLTIFAEKAASSNRIEMEKARQFLDEQIAAYAEQLRAAERRRADFRRRYADALADPISGQPKLQTLQQQLNQARLAYNQALLTRNSLQAQLRQIPASQSVASGAVVTADGRVNPAAARLAQMNATLTSLRLKYTDQHPDVIATRNAIAQIQSELEASVTESQTVPGTGPIAAMDVINPTYEQIRLKLIDAETAIPAAKERLDQALAEYERMRALSAEIPDIDAMAKDLDRDYEIIKRNHDELIARRESANLSQAADDRADRTVFRIIDPPQVPLRPSSPNMPVMFSLVLLLGLGAGFGLPVGWELFRGTFSSPARLRGLGLPVIGTVTFVGRPGSRRKALAGAAGVVIAAGALFAIYGALLVFGDGRGII